MANLLMSQANDSEGCPNYGGFWANPETGITPGEACCWCGGGNTSSGTATPSFSPTASPTVSSGDSCASIADKATCNKTSGCGYNAFESLCKTALTTSECSAFDGKKRKCKKNGCKWRRNTKTCKGRWDQDVSNRFARKPIEIQTKAAVHIKVLSVS